MRRSNVFFIFVVLTLSSSAYSQDTGLVDGRVGSDLSTSAAQSNPSLGIGPYHRPVDAGPRAGSTGMIMPGQVVPKNVPELPRPDRSGSAYVDGHLVSLGQTPSEFRGCSST
jgi:hypothetical protein